MSKTREYTVRIRTSWLRYGLVALATALIVAPVTAGASHTFDDVPDTHTFHSDIAWLADAGITSGCSATSYCPGDSVTRGQMAKFLRNLAENKVVDAATADSATMASDADLLDGQDSTAFVGTAAPLTVIAAGQILADGSVSTGTGNFTVSKDGTGDYSITIDGVNYILWDYVTLVTPASAGTMARQSSVSGDLLVDIQDDTGTATDSVFSFIIYDPTP